MSNSNNPAYGHGINVKMEQDESEGTYQDPASALFHISNVDVFGGVSGLLEDVVDQHFHSASDDGLGLGSAQSLTLYKSEPVDQEEEGGTDDLKEPVFGAFMGAGRQALDEVEYAESGAEPGNSSEAEPEEGDDEQDGSDLQDSEENSRDPEGSRKSQSCDAEEQDLNEEIEEETMNESEMERNIDYFVAENIDTYLERRGFRDTNCNVFNSIGIFDAGSCRPQSVTFGPDYDGHEIPKEIELFWKFYLKLKEESPTLSRQLKPVLIPLLVHFYQETFQAGLFDISSRIYSDFSLRFFNEDETREAYQCLRTISKISPSTSIADLEANELFQSLRRREYKFIFSELLFENLKTYLRRTNSPHILNVFACRFSVRLQECDLAYEAFFESSASVNEPYSPQSIDDNESSGSVHGEKKESADSTIELTQVTEVLHFLRNSVDALMPNVKLYAMSGKPICGAVSIQGSMIAFGMLCSEIRLCFTSKEAVKCHNLARQYDESRNIPKSRKKKKRKAVNLELAADSDETDGSSNKKDKIHTINFLRGHAGPVHAVMFHPKTKLLFSVGQDKTMRAWDLNTFQCRAVYRGHSAPIWCIDITGSGHMIVTGSMDTTARIWLPESTEYVRLLAGHYLDVDCVKFHPNEAYVATGSVDKTVRLWAVSDGSMVRVFTGSKAGLSALVFHQCGEYLIGGGEDSIIRIWSCEESETVTELTCPDSPDSASGCRDISICQNMLAAAFEDNTIRIWNLYPLFNEKANLIIEDIVQTDQSEGYDGSDDEEYHSAESIAEEGSNRSNRSLCSGSPQRSRSRSECSDAGRESDRESIVGSECELSNGSSLHEDSDQEERGSMDEGSRSGAESNGEEEIPGSGDEAVEAEDESIPETEIPVSPENESTDISNPDAGDIDMLDNANAESMSMLMLSEEDSLLKDDSVILMNGEGCNFQGTSIGEALVGSLPNLEPHNMVPYENIELDLATFLEAGDDSLAAAGLPVSAELDFVMNQSSALRTPDFGFATLESNEGEADAEAEEVDQCSDGAGEEPDEEQEEFVQAEDQRSNDSLGEIELHPVLRRTRAQLLMDAGQSVRIPSPRVIPCEASSLVMLYYRDPGQLYVLGHEIPPTPSSEEEDEESPSPDPQSQPGVSLTQSEPYFDDSMRSIFESAGLHEWPIPLPRQQHFDEDLARLLGIYDEEVDSTVPAFGYENYDFGFGPNQESGLG